MIVAAAIIVLYGSSLGYGLDWDDYHFVHRYTWSDVADAWTGSWDRTAIEAPFYRPLTVAFFAARSSAFGVNTLALHALSLVLTVLIGFAGLRWLSALGYSALPATLGTLALLMHPAMALAGPLWITNQMHLLQLMVALTMLALASKGTTRWPAILALQIVALLIKEDSAMLAPVVAGLWWLTGREISRRWVLATGIAVAAWLIVRTVALHGLGGYQGDVTGAPIANVLSVLLWMVMPTGNLWPALVLTLGVTFISIVWRRDSTALGTAALMAVLFVAPLALARGLNRGHLVMIPIALVLAEVISRPPPQKSLVAVLPALVLLGWWSTVTHTIIGLHAPCGTVVRSHDVDVAHWIADGHIDPNTVELFTAKACPSV